MKDGGILAAGLGLASLLFLGSCQVDSPGHQVPDASLTPQVERSQAAPRGGDEGPEEVQVLGAVSGAEEGDPYRRLKTTTLADYYSEALYVYNLTEDQEVFHLNGYSGRPPASLTKIMTAYVSLQEIEDLSAIAPVDIESYYFLASNYYSMAGYAPGEETTYEDLLYGNILPSGGEASASLAINLAGGRDPFVQLMNDAAKDLGMTQTHFENTTGADLPGHKMSARDTAILLREALQDPVFREIFTQPDYTSSPTAIHPDGVYMESTVAAPLEDYLYDGFEILGGKSGTTYGAGLNWATLTEKNGMEYLVIVMGVPFDNMEYTNQYMILDTIKIMDLID